ncbi:MAG TPA: GNAT family N-acetyltransferase [Gaiellaceae bacterium]
MHSLGELAEETATYLLPRPAFETIERDGLVYIAGTRGANVYRVRASDPAWVREESLRRGIKEIEWWVGWSAPTSIADELLAQGLVVDDVPVLVGMTCDVEPPVVPHVEVRRIEKLEEQLEALEVDWDAWQIDEQERVGRRDWEREWFETILESGVVHHWVARVDGAPVGFARAIDMHGAVALMGGAVLPEARGNGVYRALVRARWEHALARDTPVLVVQAGNMSAPVLDGLGFQRHGEIRLFVDRL